MVVVMVTVGVADAEGERVSVGVMLAEIVTEVVGVGEVAVTQEAMHVEPERVPPFGQV